MFNLNSPEGHTAWDYADTIVGLLHSVVGEIRDGRGDDPVLIRKPFNIQTDASGNGQAELRVPRNATWELNGIAFTGSNAGYVATYANEEAGTNLLLVNPSSALVSDTFDSVIVTADDVLLLIVARGQTAGTIVSGNIRLTQTETNTNEPKQATG